MSPASSQIDAERGRRGRERRCIVSSESLPESRLIRFALSPDGVITPDVAAMLPGRGAWVCADRAHLARAIEKGAFSRAFKTGARARPDLVEQTEALLHRRCLEHLGLMRRAGALAMGATQVEAAIRARPAFVLIEASDGAEDGREKLMSLHIGLWSRPAPSVGCFGQAELGVALGRERVIHACVLQERLAVGWAAEIGRLAGFRAIVPGSWPDSWRSDFWGLGGADAGHNQSRGRQADFDDDA